MSVARRVQTDAELAAAVHGEKGKVEVAVVEEKDVEDYPVSRSCVLRAWMMCIVQELAAALYAQNQQNQQSI